MDRKLQLDTLSQILGKKFKLTLIDKIMFFDQLFLALQVKIDKDKYPNSIFFFNDDTIYMELDIKSRNLWCSYRYIWSIFEKEFSMEYNDIQLFIKSRVEEHFNSGPVTPN